MRVVFVLALIGTALAVPRSVQRIVGGEDTTVEEYPYMTNMQFHLFSVLWLQFCGGSLLTSQSVLSAAHCYEGDFAHQWRGVFGSSQASGDGGAFHTASLIRIHQQYNSATIDADVAIVRFNNPITFAPNVSPARIAGVNYVLPDNTPVYSIGWGALSSGGTSPSQLQHVQIYTINQEICTERYDYLRSQPGFQNWPRITPGMLCAGVLDVGGRDACQGDSGGPLAHNSDIIVGVTSWGYGCAHEFYPGVNARVSHYSEWIVQNAN